MSDLVTELLREIDGTAREVFDLAERRDAKAKAGSRRTAYEKGIREVRDVAGREEARVLAGWISEEMRRTERFPSARSVRKRGAEICRENGHEVSTGSWLGA